MEIMEWILANWAYITIGILAVDKAVALTPTKWDDLIWTALKAAGKVIFAARKIKKPLVFFLLSISILVGCVVGCAELTVSEEVVGKILARRVGYSVALVDPVKAGDAMHAADLGMKNGASITTFLDILDNQVDTRDPFLVNDIKDLLSLFEFGAPRDIIASNELDYIKSILEAFTVGVKKGLGK